MGAVPKHRISKSRRRKRRGPKKLTKPTLVVCPKCKKKKEPHTVCQFCGYYNEKKVK